jgi:hypothetical protein
MTTSPHVREAALQEQADGKVRCLLCERRCLLIEGGRGWQIPASGAPRL